MRLSIPITFFFTLVFALKASAEIRVTDYLDNELVLTQPAKRIVALSPHITENIFAAGAGDLLVGTVEYSDYPAAAKALPHVGSFASLNREALLSLNPDLVIAWSSGNGEAMIAQVKSLGIPVFVDEPQQMEDVARSLQAIGIVSDRKQSANTAAKKYLSALAELRKHYQRQSTVTVLYQIWHSPIQTVNNDHIISQVMRLCGGTNIFGDAISAAPIINRETVIDRNPDVIIASGIGQERPTWLDTWRQWPSLKAVKNEHLFFIAPDFLQRHTPRILSGAQQMCEQLQSVREDSLLSKGE